MLKPKVGGKLVRYKDDELDVEWTIISIYNGAIYDKITYVSSQNSDYYLGETSEQAEGSYFYNFNDGYQYIPPYDKFQEHRKRMLSN